MPGAFLSFDDAGTGRALVFALDLDPRMPLIVRTKFACKLRLLTLAWIDFDLVVPDCLLFSSE